MSHRINLNSNTLALLNANSKIKKIARFCLFVLRFNVPVNNFSVMSGRSQRFLGLTSTVGSRCALLKEWGSNPGPLDSESDAVCVCVKYYTCITDHMYLTNSCFADCTYSGELYAHGSTFTSESGCYTCSCNNGCVECTTKLCRKYTRFVRFSDDQSRLTSQV